MALTERREKEEKSARPCAVFCLQRSLAAGTGLQSPLAVAGQAVEPRGDEGSGPPVREFRAPGSLNVLSVEHVQNLCLQSEAQDVSILPAFSTINYIYCARVPWLHECPLALFWAPLGF